MRSIGVRSLASAQAAAKANSEQLALGASAPATLMPRAMDERLDLDASLDIEGADALGPHSLWPAIVSRSTPRAPMFVGILPMN